jgi:hypothetical protein
VNNQLITEATLSKPLVLYCWLVRIQPDQNAKPLVIS